MNTEPTKKIPFILLGVLGLGVLSAYIFLWIIIDRAYTRVSALQIEIAQQEVREARAQDTGKFIEDIRDDGEVVHSFFVSRNSVVTAIETLENLEDVTGARVTISQVDAVDQTKEIPGKLMIGLSGSGTWKQISRLLALLETLPFHSNVTYVTLTTSPSPEGSATWSLQVRLEAQLTQ